LGFEKSAILGYNPRSMPILKNAKKALRVSKRKTVINSRNKSQVKTALKKVVAAASPETVSEAFSKIDRAVKRNILPKNRAARIKSRLSRAVSSSK